MRCDNPIVTSGSLPDEFGHDLVQLRWNVDDRLPIIHNTRQVSRVSLSPRSGRSGAEDPPQGGLTGEGCNPSTSHDRGAYGTERLAAAQPRLSGRLASD